MRCLRIVIGQHDDDVEVRAGGALRGDDAARQHSPSSVRKQRLHQFFCVAARIAIHAASFDKRLMHGKGITDGGARQADG